MKKILALIFVCVLLLGACTPKNESNTDNTQSADITASSDTDIESSGEVTADDDSASQGASESTSTTASESGSASGSSKSFASIKAAMMANMPYRCTYSEKGTTVVVTVKGEKFKSEATTPEGNAYAISDGAMMYSWMGDQGAKFNLADMKKFAEQQPGNQQAVDVDKNYDMDCTATTASDSLFVPPSNVEFQDMAELLQQMQQAGIPSGYN